MIRSCREQLSAGGRIRALPHPLTPYTELIVNFCPTGIVLTKGMTPHVPVTPAEVIDQACLALERGVSIVQLDARDDDENPSYRAEIYEKMILGIRAEFPDAIVSVNCGGESFDQRERRSEVLELSGAARPDLASLALQSPPELVIALAQKMVANGIKPELVCSDFGMVNGANQLIAKGLLGQPPFSFNLLLGSCYSVPATARHLAGMVDDLPPDSVWAAAGLGLFQLPMNALAIAMGGHCRVGLADNIYHGFDRTELATNQGLVERVADLSETFGRRLASPARTRELLGLRASPALSRNAAAETTGR